MFLSMASAVQMITTYFTAVVPVGLQSRPLLILTDAAPKAVLPLRVFCSIWNQVLRCKIYQEGKETSKNFLGRY